ncbi:MAG: hypothetical protein HFG02_06585 [Oscillibacter sp.]|nr:hypothetical protein [Oscillibacter sp.]
METIRVVFRHPKGKPPLTLELPRDTRFSALTALLYERDFVERQKPGWRCLYQEHLCGMNHCLADYVPEGAGEIHLDLFGFSQVLV